MKRIFVNEDWCLGCHLCEYNCAYANSGLKDMVEALKGKKLYPRIHVESNDDINYAVSCRHCREPLCVRCCIAQALYIEDGRVCIKQDKCVQCYSCIMACPFGAMSISENKVMQKCELCIKNSCGEPACVKGCPNRAIVYEER